MFKVNNRNTRKRCEICSHIFSSVSIVEFEQIHVSWAVSCKPFVKHTESASLFRKFTIPNILRQAGDVTPPDSDSEGDETVS